MDLMEVENPHDIQNIQAISLEFIDFCNRQCGFCPNSKRIQNPHDVMKEEVLEKALSELKQIDYKGAIHPYFRGESLADVNFLSKIREIKDKFPNNRIKLSTNGDYFRQKSDIQTLLDAGLTQIHICHYSNSVLGIAKDSEYGEKLTHIGLKSLKEWQNNRGGNIDIEAGSFYDGMTKCLMVNRKIFILFNGNVVLCCSDFNEEVVLGNIMEQGLLEIWNNPKYAEYRELHAEGKGKKLPLCEKCNVIQDIKAN